MRTTFKKGQRILTPLLVAATLLSVSTGCTARTAKDASARDASATAQATETQPLAAGQKSAETVCPPPLRLVLFQDKTGSALKNRTPQTAVSDLRPALDRVIRCGGDVAVGVIDERSNWPLLRLHVPEPEDRPIRPVAEGFRDEVASKLRTYRADSINYQTAERARLMSARTDADAFDAEVEKLLNRPANAPRTSIWGAMSRAGFYLAEPGHWRRRPRLVAMLVSDALETAGGTRDTLPSRSELYLINGNPSLGALKSLEPVRFESIDAAIRYLINR